MDQPYQLRIVVFKIMNGELNTACIIQHAKVLKKGFTETNIPTLLMLTVSELGEALDADRKDHHANRERYEYAKKHLLKRNWEI